MEHIGLSLGEKSVFVCQAEKDKHGWILKKFVSASMPSLVYPYDVSRAEEFKDFLKTLKGSFDLRGEGVFLSIPDTVAKTAVLEFEELPPNPKEADALIRWKTSKGVFLRPEECNISYQIIEWGGAKKVISVVAKKDVIEGFESVFSQIGLCIPRINIHSFNIFNLFSGVVKAGKNFVIAVFWQGYFSTLIFREELLDFYRCKDATDEEGFILELSATLASYRGKNPDISFEKFYLFCGKGGGALADRIKTVSDIEVEVVPPFSIVRVGEDLDISDIDPLGALSSAGSIVLRQ